MYSNFCGLNILLEHMFKDTFVSICPNRRWLNLVKLNVYLFQLLPNVLMSAVKQLNTGEAQIEHFDKFSAVSN